MRRLFAFSAAVSLAIASVLSPNSSSAQNFGAGNVIVVRVGTGTDALTNTGSPVFLDEYTPSGTFVSQTIIPTTANGANKILVLSGVATTEGFVTRSPNGMYLALAGYDRALGGAGSLPTTAAATVNRSVAIVDATKAIDLTTALTDFASAGSPRSVVTSDGTKIWGAGGTNAIRYFTKGATTSTQLMTTPTNYRVIAIADDSLYCSAATGSFRLVQIGSGLPESAGQAVVNLPGYTTATGSPYQYFFVDLNASEPGPDVLYVADDTQGILKWSKVSGTWVANGLVGSAAESYRGLAGYKNPADNSVVMFAARRGGNGGSGGGELVTLTDNTGYNVNIGTPTVTLLATAATNQAFRGVAMAPLAAVVPVDLLSFSASKTGRTHTIQWTTAQEFGASKFVVERSTDGRSFTAIQSVGAKGSALYNEYTIVDNNPLVGNNIYRLRMVDKDGSQRFSKLVRLQSGALRGFGVFPNPVVGNGGSLQVQHKQAGKGSTIAIYTADGRLMLQYPVPVNSTQTSLPLERLKAGSYRLVYADPAGERESTQLNVQ